ncbi:hypothetical protein RhiJN_28699 [Ceratobasidium sp. AG-Ba]|nr:hypothetical protein RhiJN_28699 [Ceratobasidium sp. AG-Ba]
MAYSIIILLKKPFKSMSLLIKTLSVAVFLCVPSLAAIDCLKPGATATARWSNGAGKSCTWTGVVGSNFGTNAVNGGDYSCNGRCGAGCTGTAVGNAWSVGKHDEMFVIKDALH